jgi:hypothetical protein
LANNGGQAQAQGLELQRLTAEPIGSGTRAEGASE